MMLPKLKQNYAQILLKILQNTTNLTTSAVDADPQRKRRLLSTFFVNAYPLRGACIGYLDLQPLLA